MKGVNKVILIGHLGKDPEVRHLDGNNVVANFSLATTESYMGKDGNRVDQTEWHNIVVWKGLAEIADKYLKKGSLIYLEGRIRTRSWDDKEGNKRYTTEIVANNFTMLDKKGDNNGGNNSTSSNQQQSAAKPSVAQTEKVTESFDDTPEDDLPF